MDRRAAVQRHVGNHVASHQLDQERTEPDLDDVPPEHGDHCVPPRGSRQLAHQIAQVLRR